jgi:hypothetical protein
MSEPSQPNPLALNRRELIVAAGAAAVAVYLPFASEAVVAPPVGAATRGQTLADWSIDDQWGVYPRYDAISSVPNHGDDARLTAVQPVDRAFVV